MKRLLFLASLIALWSANAGAEANPNHRCPADSAKGIANIFDQSITENEQFKKDENEKAGEHIEEITETVLEPCSKRAVEKLVQKDQPELAKKYLEFIVSYENSADENLPYSLGMLWGKRPNIIRSRLKDLDEAKQQILLSQLEFGWENVKGEFDKKTARQRNAQILELSSEYGRKNSKE